MWRIVRCEGVEEGWVLLTPVSDDGFCDLANVDVDGWVSENYI